MFSKDKDFEILKHGVSSILKINYLGKENFPSIEDDGIVMRDTIKRIIQNPSITKIIFVHNKNYEYDFEVVEMLREIGKVYEELSKRKEIFQLPDNKELSEKNMKIFFSRYTQIQNLILKDLLSDPIGTYIKIKRMLRDYRFEEEFYEDDLKILDDTYLDSLKFIISKLEKVNIIKKVVKNLQGHKIEDRKIYSNFIRANVKPNFIYTSLLKKIPYNAKELDSYEIDDFKVQIFSLENEAYNLYHITPKEFELSDSKYSILNLAKEVIAEHSPQSNDFIEPSRLREVFFNISKDLIVEISTFKNVDLTNKEIEELSNILIKYTVGFGLVEDLLADENIQDISINAPSNKTPIFITHSKYEDCKTNIIPEFDEVEGWASRLRMISGKPLDSANPLLDTEIETPRARARVSVIGKPLNPYGLGFSFRRHRDKPWTLPLFIKNKMINYKAAGLLSFIVDGARTFLIAGTRGSGKSSFLTAIMIEILRKYRIITIEDTLEIPTLDFSNLGFNIQSMSVKSALSISNEGFDADKGIRSTLRLGDSCLIVGEVRSTEALALYEAMRVGALANVVGGTIHGDSAYGVYDRLVNDLGVPKTSFKATDIIMIANPIKSSDGLSRKRRITQIVEVKKNWNEDPIMESGFNELFKYDTQTDELMISDNLINGESDILKSIGANIKQFSGDWDAIWNNITLRGDIKKYHVDKATELNCDELLEAKPVIDANDMFHKISQKILDETNTLDNDLILNEFKHWFDFYSKNFVENLK